MINKAWKAIVCAFTHPHITMLVPISRSGSMGVYRRREICIICYEEALEGKETNG